MYLIIGDIMYLDHILDLLDKNIKLDEYQKQIVLDNSKNLLVVAGAGSGKTTTMLAKIKYLIEIKKIKNNSILVLAFNQKNVKELNYKLNTILKLDVDVMTFHKLGKTIIDNNHKIIDKNIKKEVIMYYIKNSLKNKIYYIKSIIYLSKEHTLPILVFTKKSKEILLNKIIYLLSNDIIYFLDNMKINNIKTIKNCLFKDLLESICEKYNEYLKDNNLIEFEDYITIPCKSNIKLNYKYIIVDEYQDISKNRFDLINNIRITNNCNFIGVGDDWQAIYEFAGSNVSYFSNIDKYIKDIKILKLINTYRCSQELINVAGKFISKNKNQIKKQLISTKRINNPIIFNKKLEEILNEISGNYIVGFLGRYSFEEEIINSILKKEKDYYIFKALKIYFTTVHKSKGLEFDYVIINMSNGIYGFPSLKKCKDIDKLLNKFKKTFYEERRLYYVALTRTKNCVYLLGSNNKFIKETIKIINKKE